MNNPKVTVIIPTYNLADLLPRAINSVINQTYKDWELLVVDDGSTDNTKEVIKEYGQKDKRIKSIFLEKNSGGPAHPKNIGIQNSKGEYIAFLDHDDEWLPEKLEKQIELFEKSKNSKLGFVGCNALIFNQWNNREYQYKTPKYKDVFKGLLMNNFIFSSSSVMVKKSVFEKIGLFDENLQWSDDWDMWLRISQNYDFDFIPDFLFRYYVHNTNTSRLMNPLDKKRELEYFLQKYIKYYKNHPACYSNMMRALGMNYIDAKQNIIGRKYFLKAIKINPFNIKNYICLFTYGSSLYNFLRFIKYKLTKFPFIY